MVEARPTREGEQGYILLGLIVAIFLMLLALSVAAPRVAHELRRERELEAQRRAQQYVRAIQLYYRKNGNYPGSIEQLEKTNNIRFLRQKYVDPLTGKADWRLIHLGQAKTTVKGFFGQPLAGIAAPGSLGSIAGMASNIGGNQTVNSSSPTGSSAFGSSSFGSSSFGSSSTSTPTTGSTGTTTSTDSSSPTAGGTGTVSPTTGGIFGSSGVGSQSATTFSGGGAPIMGIGSSATGNSILVVNEQKTYPTWEFLYDPRIEQLYSKANVYGGTIGSTPASSFGSGTPGSSPGTPGSTSTPGSSSGFGSSSFGSSSFGSSSSSGSSTPTTTTQ